MWMWVWSLATRDDSIAEYRQRLATGDGATVSTATWKPSNTRVHFNAFTNNTTKYDIYQLEAAAAAKAPTGKDIKPREFIQTKFESIAREAYDLELIGMTKYGHRIITKDKHGTEQYNSALRASEQGRAIFSCKRKDMHGNQQFKARCVKQGFRSPSAPGTNIYSPVVRGDEFRATVLRPNRNAAHP